MKGLTAEIRDQKTTDEIRCIANRFAKINKRKNRPELQKFTIVGELHDEGLPAKVNGISGTWKFFVKIK